VAALRYEQRNRRGQRRRSLQVLIGLKIAERRRQLFPSQVPDSFETAAVAAAQRSRLAEEFFARISNEVRFAERAGGYPLGAISQITEGTPMHTQTKVLATALLAGFAALPTLAMAQAKGGNADLGFSPAVPSANRKSTVAVCRTAMTRTPRIGSLAATSFTPISASKAAMRRSAMPRAAGSSSSPTRGISP